MFCNSDSCVSAIVGPSGGASRHHLLVMGTSNSTVGHFARVQPISRAGSVRIGTKIRSGRRGKAPTGSREVSPLIAALSAPLLVAVLPKAWGLRGGLHRLLVIPSGGFQDALYRRPLGAECGHEGAILAV